MTQYSNRPMVPVPVRHVIYLHGFASSPGSSKAQWFARELARRGVGFSCPDFNLPSFGTLTVTRMLDQTQAAIAAAGPGPVALIGSSLGAFVAVHAAARHAADARASGGPASGGTVDRLILLAPALEFGGNRLRQLGEHGIDEWRTRGTLRVFHYAMNEPAEVGFALYEDAARYDAFALEVPWPTLVFQGTRDASVDPAMVVRWASSRPAVDLRMVDDEHQLTASMDEIWEASQGLLGL
jgi:pimeloyl-ACP methyl ester carboxylesterase